MTRPSSYSLARCRFHLFTVVVLLALSAYYLIFGVDRHAFATFFPLNCLSYDSTTRQEKAPDHKGGVASQSALCSRIGLSVLERGGNAADAVSRQSCFLLIVNVEG